MDAGMTALGQPGGLATATALKGQNVYPTTFPSSFPLGHLNKANPIKGKGYAFFKNAVTDKLVIFFIAFAVCGVFMFVLLACTFRIEAGKKREDTMISEATHGSEHKHPSLAMRGPAPVSTPPENRYLMPGTHSRAGSVASSVGSTSTVSTTVNGYLAPPPRHTPRAMYSLPAGAGSGSTFSSTSTTASMNPYHQQYYSVNAAQFRPRYNQYHGPPPPLPSQRPQLLAPPPRVDRRPRAPAWRGPGHPGLPSQQPPGAFRPLRPPAQPRLQAPQPRPYPQQIAFTSQPQAQQPHAAVGSPPPQAQQPHAAFGQPRPPPAQPAYPTISGPPTSQSRQQATVVRSASQRGVEVRPPTLTAGPHAALAAPPDAPFSPTSPPTRTGTPLWAQ